MTSKKSSRRGRFIVLEGIDGAGTTTQLRHTADWLIHRGEVVHLTHEPTDGPLGLLLRQILRGRLVSTPPALSGDARPQPLDPAVVALLFAADRLDHLQNEILPHLEAGRHVLCDRYLLSSLAYQSLDTDLRFIRNINEKALTPDLTIFLRVRPDVAMTRIAASRMTRDTFEQLSIQRKVAATYDKLLETYREGTVAILDGEEEPSIVMTRIRAALEPFF